MSGITRDIARIELQIDRIIALCASADFDRRAPRVSGWPVSRQLDHLSLAGMHLLGDLLAIARTGDVPRRATRKGKSLTGSLLLWLGWIPRGLGKAPKGVRPDEVPDAAQVRARFDDVRRILGELKPLQAQVVSSRARMSHPYFGGLTPAEWVRFVSVHQHHHLKIVRDILSAPR